MVPDGYRIRTYQSADLARIQQITLATFASVSIDANIEQLFGPLPQSDWRQRKLADLAEDCRLQPDGIFIAEDVAETIAGYITTRLDRANGIGFIPNLAVDPTHQNRGLARALLQHALMHFRRAGLSLARIETLAQNPVGQHLYPSLSFVEVARQIHYALKLTS